MKSGTLVSDWFEKNCPRNSNYLKFIVEMTFVKFQEVLKFFTPELSQNSNKVLIVDNRGIKKKSALCEVSKFHKVP